VFADSKAFSGFAAPDIEQAKQFYADTLGIEVTEEHGLLTLHLNGGERPTLIYPKPDHEPAVFTIFNLVVEDIDRAVDELNDAGVVTKIYEAPDDYGTDERGIARGSQSGQGPDIAWFRDPAGNVLSVIGM
jgi:catechol 2,3-dioxygenase-like lactoylglutathione lyase family enzyme